MDIESYLSNTQHTKKTKERNQCSSVWMKLMAKSEIPLSKLKDSAAAGYIKQRVNDSKSNDPKLIHQFMFGH